MHLVNVQSHHSCCYAIEVDNEDNNAAIFSLWQHLSSCTRSALKLGFAVFLQCSRKGEHTSREENRTVLLF